jgi:hypothetical protein
VFVFRLLLAFLLISVRANAASIDLCCDGQDLHGKPTFSILAVLAAHCVVFSISVDGGVGPSNTTALGSVLYWFSDDMFRPRKAIFRSISILQKRLGKN